MPEKPSPASQAYDEWQRVMTVTGPVTPESMGRVNAHEHLWIAPPPGSPVGIPRLDDYFAALDELHAFKTTGGASLVDCQPGGCGRDGLRLADLSRAAKVRVVACTGFHLARYYPPDAALLKLSAQAACDWYAGELLQGLSEARRAELTRPPCAGFIKAALEDRLSDTPLALLEGAAQAARQTGAALYLHTQKGAAVEDALRFLTGLGLSPHRLVLCHMDKRPDFGLHRELAAAGVLLEYDTFFRPAYEPERNLWPLLDRMISAGLAGQVALATDLADSHRWQAAGGPGMGGLFRTVRLRLAGMGCDSRTQDVLLGGSIARRLSFYFSL